MPEPTTRPVGRDTVLVTVDGTRTLIAAACPHRGGRLRFGRIDAGRITCPLHHASFDLTTGDQVGGPPCGPLRVTPIS